jgi:GDP-L-fucose synthase
MNLHKKTYYEQTLPTCSYINLGSGKDFIIRELAETIKQIVGFKGEIKFDPSKPHGPPKNLLDSERIKNIDFNPKISLMDGFIKTYYDYTSKQNANI